MEPEHGIGISMLMAHMHTPFQPLEILGGGIGDIIHIGGIGTTDLAGIMDGIGIVHIIHGDGDLHIGTDTGLDGTVVIHGDIIFIRHIVPALHGEA